MIYRETIAINKELIEQINNYLKLTGDELYNQYGLKRDETITFTAHFEDDFEADIKVVICDGKDTPYIDAILFDDTGHELVVCDPIFDTIDGDYYFDLHVDNSDTKYEYYVTIKEEKAV